MKKILVAALASAFAAPAAFAATSNVDIYGRVAATYNVLNTDTSVVGQDKTLYQVSSDQSWIGFKGNENLGGGLAAVYQLEVGFDVSGGNSNMTKTGSLAGTNTFIYRNTFVGMKSNDFGTVLLGKIDTPYKTSTARLDVFGNEPADYRNIIGNVAGISVFAQRPGNVIVYMTPNMMGFAGAVAYVAGNPAGNGTASNANAWSVAGMYSNGPIYATLAYEKQNNVTGYTYFTGGTPATIALGTMNNHAWKAGVGYDFGPGKVGFIYENATLDTTSSLGNNSRTAYYLDGAYNVTGNIVLKAAWGHAGSLSNVSNSGANSYAVGADYVFSKRTKLIAQYQKISNDSAGTYGVNFGGGSSYYAVGNGGYAGGTTGAAGNDPSIIAVGIVHTF